MYLAQHPRLPRQDALKIMPASLTGDAQYRDRFNREADIAASLWHPHIVGLHDRGEHEGQLWIAMDYVDGTDAARYVRDRHLRHALPEAVEIVTAIAEALDYAHERHLLHRDVKPANILLTGPEVARRRILLADFGVARRIDDISGITATNMAVGSMAYSAPEQLLGQTMDGRADQYALAASAFQLLAGHSPFHHSNPAVVISEQLNELPAQPARQSSGTGLPGRGHAQGHGQGPRWPLRAVRRFREGARRRPGDRPGYAALLPRCSRCRRDRRRRNPAGLRGSDLHRTRAPGGQCAAPLPTWSGPSPIPQPRQPQKPSAPQGVAPGVLAVLLVRAIVFAISQFVRRPGSVSTPSWQPYVDAARPSRCTPSP